MPGSINKRKPKADAMTTNIYAPSIGKNFARPACNALIGFIS